MDPTFQISHTYIWSVPYLRLSHPSPTNIHARRTRESVENLFHTLYPISTRPPNTTLTMHVKPSILETMISPAAATCPKLANLTAQYTASAAYKSTLSPYTSLQSTLVAAYNTSHVPGYNTTQTLYDTASATYCHNLGLKGNLTADDIQLATIPGTSAYHNLFRPSNPDAEQAKKLAVGGWLQAIMASLNDTSTKLEVYSAHDASLDMFLSVVADPDLPWPPFAANVLTEVWTMDEGEKVVRMYYEGMAVPAVDGLDCDFGEGCALHTLQAFLEGYVPDDFKDACAL